MSNKPEQMPLWGLAAFSWIVAFYFLFGLAFNLKFPPSPDPHKGDVFYALISLFFLFLPFFSKIKLGKFLELEREVAKAKDELNEFKAEIRNNMSVLSMNVNTIGRMTNQVTVNMPGVNELRQARETVEENAPENKQKAEQIEQLIVAESEDDYTLALARTRIDIERLLRKWLEKTPIPVSSPDVITYVSVTRLFELFISRNQEFSYLKKPFRYVTQICNAAIHALTVPEAQAKEALGLGAQIIGVLKEFTGGAE